VLGQIARLDLLDAGLGHVFPRLADRPVDIDAAARILHDINIQAGIARIERRPGDAEIRGKAGHEDRIDLTFLQVAGKTGAGLLVGLEERRVAVDVVVVTLADDQRRLGNVDILGDGPATAPDCRRRA
jgi:hypothetical protein